ncbi:MAG TPA: ATPase domain-containing protein [Vicinamibacterales bacterium]|nr:ATPase domain-containing protein [Vicinamibacterales bacterium]
MISNPHVSAPPTSVKSTGISGLDTLLKGGLPADRVYLVEGDPGTGKTTLALQFLLEGRDRGESCLYVTLAETGNELFDIARSHGFSLDNIHVYQLKTPEPAAGDTYTLYHPAEIELGEMMQNVLDMTERTKPSRVVFDSLSEVRLLARDSLRYRRQVLALKDFFAGRECTVLLLDDKTSGDHDLQLQSISHGVIQLDQQPFDFGRARRRVRVVKLRGVAAIDGFHDFRIRRGGLEVYPQLVPDAGPRRSDGALIASGIAELDAILGGGLNWGTCTLFIGPAGVGKSTIAAQYVVATALEKRQAAIFLFDERIDTFVRRCDALGMDMTRRIEAGEVTIRQVEPGELSPGEFSHLVCASVEAGARIVIIDSLNGYLNAISNTSSPLVRMHELLSYLNERSVATLLIAAQHGMIGSNMPVPVDISYLADCVIMLRYFEAHGSVRKALSVMKKRTGEHETSIREFSVQNSRVRVGAPLTEFQGVLTGVPTYRGGSAPLLRNEPPAR